MNIMQKLYEDAQAACGLQVGDWVKVVDCGLKCGDKWTNNGMWWDFNKQNMIGNIFNIGHINNDGICCNNLYFPYFALEKISYEEAQKASGLKVLDWVKITRKAEKGEKRWDNEWTPVMDNNIGKIGQIEYISQYGITVVVSNDIGFVYPFFILEKVPAPEQKPESEKKEHELKPFDKVLVRDFSGRDWEPDIFRYKYGIYYYCMTTWWHQCIPYEGNEHLLGTTNIPEE